MKRNILTIVLLVTFTYPIFVNAFAAGRSTFRPNMKTFSKATFAQTNRKEANEFYEDQVELPSGVSMQVLSSYPDKQDPNKPVLLFLHGSFHGAWCWQEKFFSFFVSRGYTVVAPSWRGTGGTPAGEGVKTVQIMQHVADLDGLLDALPSLLESHGIQSLPNKKPVVISHSFGNFMVMKYLEVNPLKRSFSGVISLCLLPKMTLRFFLRSLVASWKITTGFVMKQCLIDNTRCRQLLFGGEKIMRDDGTIDDHGVSDDDVKRYQTYFARDSAAIVDMVDFVQKIPLANTLSDGRAAFINESFPPCLVMGASDDYLVDREGLNDAARLFGLKQPLIVDSPHNVMLGSKWGNAANALNQWILENVVTA